MKGIALFIWSVMGLCAAAGCLAGPPYNVDDPGTTEFKHFNLQIAYLSCQNSGGELQAIPGCVLNYGLTENIEIGMGFGINSMRASGEGRRTGLGDTCFTCRWRFQEETKKRPQILIGYQLKMPTADSSRGLGTGAADHNLWLSAGKSYSRYFLYGNLGFSLPGNHALAKDNLYYGMGLTYQVSEKWIAGAQVYGNAANAPHCRDELAWSFGLTYAYVADRMLLLSLGRSEHDFSDLNVYAGIAITFK